MKIHIKKRILMRDIFRNQYISRGLHKASYLFAEEKGRTTNDKQLFGINGHKCDDFISKH